MLSKALEKIDLFVSHFRYAHLYFSQNGEDILLEEIFHNEPTGTYVDVGCHHPVRYSNTFLLYKKGWSGVCFDPDKRNVDEFRLIRPRDIFVPCAVGSELSIKEMFIFNDGALNTFDAKQAKLWGKVNGKPVKEKVKVIPLYLLEKEIDLLCIDTEGSDLDVLKSLDWERQQPKVIVVELPKNNGRINSFLTKKGYELIAKTNTCGFYKI